MRNTQVKPKPGTIKEIQKVFPMSKGAISKYLHSKLRNATGNKIKKLALELGGEIIDDSLKTIKL